MIRKRNVASIVIAGGVSVVLLLPRVMHCAIVYNETERPLDAVEFSLASGSCRVTNVPPKARRACFFFGVVRRDAGFYYSIGPETYDCSYITWMQPLSSVRLVVRNEDSRCRSLEHIAPTKWFTASD